MRLISERKKRIIEEINKNPSHGYELAHRLDIPLSSIYEHLRDLRENQLVEAQGEKNRKVYMLTEKGRHMFKAL